MISIDTLRRDHVSVFGYPRPTTPNLERLAASGIVFENAIAADTNTAPSHASLLTGLHPSQHGVVRNGGYELRPGVVTLAEALGTHHASAAFVSGFPLQRRMTNLYRGFGHYDDDLGEGWQRDAATTLAGVDRWLRARSDERPLLLWVHFYDPHHPYDAPEPFRSRFLPEGRTGFAFPLEGAIARFAAGEAAPEEFDEYVRRYDGEIAYADDTVGRLFGLLEERGLWDRAIVVVVSDHGETLDERPTFFDHGARLYDEQVRVPFLLRLPGNRRAGTRVRAPVHHVDLVPTLLELLGRAVPPGMSGRSLLPLIEGSKSWSEERPMFSTASAQDWQVPELAAKLDDMGLVQSVRTPHWKLIAYPGVEGEILQLFRLDADPGETRNLADAEPERREELRRELRAWRIATDEGAPIEVPELGPADQEGLRALGYLD